MRTKISVNGVNDAFTNQKKRQQKLLKTTEMISAAVDDETEA